MKFLFICHSLDLFMEQRLTNQQWVFKSWKKWPYRHRAMGFDQLSFRRPQQRYVLIAVDVMARSINLDSFCGHPFKRAFVEDDLLLLGSLIGCYSLDHQAPIYLHLIPSNCLWNCVDQANLTDWSLNTSCLMVMFTFSLALVVLHFLGK